MEFRRGVERDEPEINLIAMIDVLLVILIFLMVTTTFTRFSEMKINLPTAEANKPQERANEVQIGVDAQGKYVINSTPVAYGSVSELRAGTSACERRAQRTGRGHQCGCQRVASVRDQRHGSCASRRPEPHHFATQGPTN
jgi:biopolymer transport protein ExbD